MANRRREVGYMCRRGHFVFVGEEDYGYCQSKRLGTIYVESDYPDDEMFSESYEERDHETGQVWYSSSGHSEKDYEDTVDESLASLERKIEAWRNA